MTTVLTLDAALDGCGAGIVVSGDVVAVRSQGGGRGSAAALPALAAEVLAAAGIDAAGLSAIAVTVGPGSFTGVRAALALAQGIGLGAGAPVVGVHVGDAIRAACGDRVPVWVVIDSKRGRVFLDDGTSVVTVGLDELPAPVGAVWIAGDAAAAVCARLRAAGHDATDLMLTGSTPAGIALAAQRMPRPALPLYVDAPEARPTAARRPAPAG